MMGLLVQVVLTKYCLMSIINIAFDIYIKKRGEFLWKKYEVFSRLSEGASLKEFKDFIDDKVVVLAAIEKEAYNLRFASDRLKDDEDVVLFAISKKGMTISYASDRLKNRTEFITKNSIDKKKCKICSDNWKARESRWEST